MGILWQRNDKSKIDRVDCVLRLADNWENEHVLTIGKAIILKSELVGGYDFLAMA